MATKTYRLANEHVGFFDPETGDKVVRDGVLELDVSERTGKLTLATIKAGGLIEVNAKAEKKAAEGGGGATAAEKKKAGAKK